MPQEASVKISKFAFWVLTSVLGLIMAGFGTWIATTHSTISELQIEMVRTSSNIDHIKVKMDEYLKSHSEFNTNVIRIALLESQVAINTRIVQNGEHNSFSMADYDKYVKPMLDDILKRLDRLDRLDKSGDGQ